MHNLLAGKQLARTCHRADELSGLPLPGRYSAWHGLASRYPERGRRGPTPVHEHPDDRADRKHSEPGDHGSGREGEREKRAPGRAR